MNLTAISKFMSYVLRHHPEAVGLELDNYGWANIAELTKKAKQYGKPLDRHAIDQTMNKSGKQRFILSENEQYNRATYGHSIDVDLQMKPADPPKVLFHGTAQRHISSIMREGIIAGKRKFVHLSVTREEAKKVGSRHGKPIILAVKAQKMAEQGYELYQSESEPHIWLTNWVPSDFLEQM